MPGAVGAKPLLVESGQANEAITRFRFVKRGTGSQNVDMCDTLGEVVWGVAEFDVSAADATAGAIVSAITEGIVVVEAGAALAVGVPVRTSATGKAVALAAATANQNVAGIVETPSGADGDWINVRLTPGSQQDT
jgi:hypothetical protein